jgi:hypothetical protein
VDSQGLSLHTLPCSSEVENEHSRPTRFDEAILSPDESLVAVEAFYYYDSNYNHYVLIYDLDGALVYAWLARMFHPGTR